MASPGVPPHVVIIGGGFAGLAAAKSLRRARVRLTVVDRRNHHVFQPLLYQVATAALSPAQIAAPIRRIISRTAHTRVLLAEARAVDTTGKRVILTDGEIRYDYLILACGATHSYFGHEEWAAHAPGLKTIEDALDIRARFLLAFEQAEREDDAAVRQAHLTFVVIGAGPTGVELAGAMIEIARQVIPRDFDRVDTATARVILVEAQDRVLPGFPPALSARALADLTKLGVEVRLRTRVTTIDAAGVTAESAGGAVRLEARNAIWAAGVRASPLGASLGTGLDRAGRVTVAADLSVPGHPEVFVIGDLATVPDAVLGTVPGMAPGAMQMGRFVAGLIARDIREGRREPRPAFRYHHKGFLATIGRSRAVANVFGMEFAGFPAWALWAVVHVLGLIDFRSRMLVVLDWLWSYVFFERGARLITTPPNRDADTAPKA